MIINSRKLNGKCNFWRGSFYCLCAFKTQEQEKQQTHFANENTNNKKV